MPSSRHRRTYDCSPSPSRSVSPTLVGSNIGTEHAERYCNRRYNRPCSTCDSDDSYRDRNDSYPSRRASKLAKVSVIVGLFLAFAGLFHLRSKLEGGREQQNQTTYRSRTSENRRDLHEDRRRHAAWEEWKDNGKKGRLLNAPDGGNGRRMIEAPRKKRDRESTRGNSM